MLCNYCHSETADDSTFCMVCGKKVNTLSDENNNYEKDTQATATPKPAAVSAQHIPDRKLYTMQSIGKVPIPEIAGLVSVATLLFAMFLMLFAPIHSIEKCNELCYWHSSILFKPSGNGRISFFTLFIYSIKLFLGTFVYRSRLSLNYEKPHETIEIPYLKTITALSIIRLLVVILTVIILVSLTTKLMSYIMGVIRRYGSENTKNKVPAVEPTCRKFSQSSLCKWICVFLDAILILISGTSIYGGATFFNLMIIALFWISIACEIFVYLQKSKNQTID